MQYVKVVERARQIAANNLRGYAVMGYGDVLVVDAERPERCPPNVDPDALAIAPLYGR